MTPGSRRAVLALGLAAVLAMTAACSSKSKSASAGGSGGGSSSSTINLGLIGPLTGARANAGQGMVMGASEALKVINDNGGVLGHKVKLVTQDDASDPGDAIPAAEKEISSDHVVAIVGPASATASVVLTQADRAKIPDLMYGGGAAFDNVTDPYFFRMSASDSEQAGAMALYAKSKGWTKVAFAIGNAPADQSLLPPLQDYAKRLGLTVTATVTIALNSTSFRSEINKIVAGHPQAVLTQFDIPSAGVLFSELGQQGLLSMPWIASNLWYAAEFPKSVGTKVATGPIYILNPSSGGDGEAAFLKTLKEQTGRTQPTNGEEDMWDAVNSWALGVETAGSFKSPQVEQGIVKAGNGPGTACNDFPSCSALIKAGTSINWDGAASSTDFNQYHNVFGNFDALHYNNDGSVTKLVTITSQQVQGS